MTLTTGFAIWAISLLAVAALGRSRTSARIGVVIAAALTPLPLLIDGEPMLRAALAFLLAVLLAAAVEFATGRTHPVFANRLVFVFALHGLIDTFTATPTPRRFDTNSAMRTFVALAIGVGAFLLWRATFDWDKAPRAVAWNLAAIVLVLAVAEIMTSSVRLATGLFGVELQPVHDRPHLSRTVGEFWSKRWNLMTGRWLRIHTFLPLVRRSPLLALLAAFTLSAAMHVYLILVPGDAWAWLSWAAFFMAQPLLILAERKLHVRHWPPLAARTWTIGSLALLSPLLFIPILKLITPIV